VFRGPTIVGPLCAYRAQSLGYLCVSSARQSRSLGYLYAVFMCILID
jgi:hypothetical protein